MFNQAGRNELVWALAQHGIQIDIYGKCGLTLVKGWQLFCKTWRTLQILLALENSLCVDYVTEKMYHGLFHNMFRLFGL
ncbi:Alpha-(1,3)-fucosyltransferase C [Orchesella cincta]|uniref:Fucosyltransferase n=1 Tax=Orchesella cincta TaxID=48709 RepID=A0A1D2M2M4_ORCCI|nr:Alpha-(1,3)-fucosyltransferase C [Orchesella cincta]